MPSGAANVQAGSEENPIESFLPSKMVEPPTDAKYPGKYPPDLNWSGANGGVGDFTELDLKEAKEAKAFLDQWIRDAGRGEESWAMLTEACERGAIEYHATLYNKSGNPDHKDRLLKKHPPRICNRVNIKQGRREELPWIHGLSNGVDLRELTPLARRVGCSRVIFVEVAEGLNSARADKADETSRYDLLIKHPHPFQLEYLDNESGEKTLFERTFWCSGVAKFEDGSEEYMEHEHMKSRILLLSPPPQYKQPSSEDHQEFTGMERVNHLLSTFGDFQSVQGTHKQVERLSLLASTCKASYPISEYPFTEVEDIKDKGDVMTDGCGRISPFLLEDIAKALGEAPESTVSVMVRGLTSKGMYKGLLQRCPSLPTKDGVHIEFVESMRKVKANSETEVKSALEVKQLFGSNRSCIPDQHLNRQVIKVLHSVGMPDLVPMSLLDCDIKAGFNLLGGLRNDQESLRLSLPLGMFERRLVDEGGRLDEIMVKSLLRKQYLSSLESLQKNMHVKGGGRQHAGAITRMYNAVGVPDHTRTLREGQVCLLPDPLYPDHFITGKVLVTRCPCLDPSDVRLLEATEPNLISL